jgi:HK97 gp10 family phage protein
MATFYIDGVKEIKKAFRELEPKLARKVIRQAIRKGLKPVLAAVKRNTPVSSRPGSAAAGHAPGELRKMVKLRASKKRKRGVIGLTVNISDNRQGKTYYGAFVNFGTKKIKPRHFVEKSYAETKDQAAAIAKREILAGIEREASR